MFQVTDAVSAKPRLLLSLDSYGSTPPTQSSIVPTMFFGLTCLFAIEHACRWLVFQIQDYSPSLALERNRQILARHIGTDAFCCTFVAVLGWKCFDICQCVIQAAFGGKKTMPKAAYATRLYTYHPAAYRLTLLFSVYQIKNMYDSIVWNDGQEFIFHHCFSLLTAYGGMNPGTGFFYSIFFFGISEISTAILCVLANFDDEHGVIGLGSEFPLTKVTIGACFVTMFITCRCILWPIFSFYFCRDVAMALNDQTSPQSRARTGWFYFFFVSLSGLSVLQIAWLGEIFVTAKKEMIKMGYL